MSGVRVDQWPGYITEIFRILNPGTGWAQCTEGGAPFWDGPVPNDSYYAQVDFFHKSVAHTSTKKW